MRSVRGDVRDHIVFAKKPDHGPSYLAGIAAVETPKHRLSRAFGSLSIFDFFNSIGHNRLP